MAANGFFRPADSLLGGAPVTDLQLRMYLGRLIGIYLRGKQISNRVMTQTIDAGLSWQCPAYGLVEDGAYHVAGDDVLINASTYLQRVPFASQERLARPPPPA